MARNIAATKRELEAAHEVGGFTFVFSENGGRARVAQIPRLGKVYEHEVEKLKRQYEECYPSAAVIAEAEPSEFPLVGVGEIAERVLELIDEKLSGRASQPAAVMLPERGQVTKPALPQNGHASPDVVIIDTPRSQKPEPLWPWQAQKHYTIFTRMHYGDPTKTGNL